MFKFLPAIIRNKNPKKELCIKTVACQKNSDLQTMLSG
jgi:hypothetical protein